MISEENQLEEDIDIELDEEIEEEDYAPELEEDEEVVEEPKEKPKLTKEQERGILQRRLTKLNKELGMEAPKTTAKKTTKTADIDLGHLAFHNSKSNTVKVEHDEDIAYLQETMAKTGSSQSELLNDDYFQGILKQRQESRVAKAAVPSNSKRSNTTTQNEVQYWINKGQMPPADQVQLRRDVLNARLKMEGEGSKFYNA